MKARLLDRKTLSSLSNEDLEKWYSTVDRLCKREGVMSDLQFSKTDLREELESRGFLEKITCNEL